MGKVSFPRLLPRSGPIEQVQQQRPVSHSQSVSGVDEAAKRSKGSSFWSAIFGQQFHKNFECVFSVHIHSIRNLPLSLEGQLLEVHCIRKSRAAITLQSRCDGGVAEFEETLHLRSKVRASRNVPHAIKQPVSKSFRLLVVGSGNVLGEITLDLGTTLPSAIADITDFASKSAWTSAFRVASPSGKIKGASIVASIGYEFVDVEGTKSDKQRSSSSFWRRSIRPLSGLISSSSNSSVAFSRCESMRSMPDLWGLAQEAYGYQHDEEDEEDERMNGEAGAADSLDSALCSLVRAQMAPPAAVQESMEVSTDEHASSEDERYGAAFEPLVVETVVKPEVHIQDEQTDTNTISGTGSSGSTSVTSESGAGSVDDEEVALQFLRMLKDEPVAPVMRRISCDEPLGSPVYEANNWMLLTPIPEEDAAGAGDEDEEERGTSSSSSFPYSFSSSSSSYLSSSSSSSVHAPNVEPEVHSAEFHAFVPVWRREDDLELECIMQAAEVELERAIAGA